MNIFMNNGLKVRANGFTLALDSGGRADYYLISHAHSDHVNVKNGFKVLCSPETAAIIMHRYSKSLEYVNSLEGVDMLNAGHIFGSNAFFINDGETLFYTGDFSNQDRLFLKKGEVRQADNLIMDTTYGDPFYKFPNQEEELKKARDWVQDTLKSRNVMLLCYSLGKAQLLSKAIHGIGPTYAHWTIQKMNQAHSFLGLDLPIFRSLDLNNTDERFIYLLPPHLMSSLGKGLKKKFNMKVAIFSGWVKEPLYTLKYGADKGFILSDHVDFNGLKDLVKKVSPKKVYTIYGYSERFAKEISKEGYSAEALD